MFTTFTAPARTLVPLISAAVGLLAFQPAGFAQSPGAKFQAGVQCMKGDALLQSGKYREAIGHYDRAIELNPALPYPHYARGFALYRLGDREEAIESYSRAIALDPEFADAYQDRGLIRLEVGD